MAIQINNIQEKVPVKDEWLGLLENILQRGLNNHSKFQGEVSVVLVNDEYIRELNLEYRGLDQTTDVLSFALEEELTSDPVLPEDAPQLLGDIYISVERALEQAQEYNHSFHRELCYLAVHGLLHLLSFDHQSAEQTAIMRAEEEKMLEEFSLGRNCP